MCYLDTNNYRGITLLSNFNKIFEVLLWGRIEKWWWDSGCISMLQGACRKKQSCLHTALLLQETISEALETNKNVFVSYCDVSKAFDGVWTNGLFIKLYEMGITGKIWRVLFRAYDDFKCRARVGGKVSGWYNMLCWIHQGGFLSLFKYTAFINALLVSLETSGLCCSIMGIPSSPGGYADDIATACLSKTRSDKVHDIVYKYGRKWRFFFNAKKSAVLVYREVLKTYQKSHDLRHFKLGPDRVHERREYGHVGVKNCDDQESEICVKEKIEKGRKALNASSGIGIRKNGISIAAANLIYWTIVIPILTFGSELWILTDKDKENLNMFQRYASRRIQRFPARSPNCSSSYGLGWVRITTYICVKKLLFLYTMIMMDVDNVAKRVFMSRFEKFQRDTVSKKTCNRESPIYDLLEVCQVYGLLGVIGKIISGDVPQMGKNSWKKLVWDRAWNIEEIFWSSTIALCKENNLLRETVKGVGYMIWWQLSDVDHSQMRMCECMARILARASRLKCDDVNLKGLPLSYRACDKCEYFAQEDIFHIVMQCPGYQDLRVQMNEVIKNECGCVNSVFEENPSKVFWWLLGGDMEGINMSDLHILWKTSGKFISHM